jgi:hypothetical protein
MPITSCVDSAGRIAIEVSGWTVIVTVKRMRVVRKSVELASGVVSGRLGTVSEGKRAGRGTDVALIAELTVGCKGRLTGIDTRGMSLPEVTVDGRGGADDDPRILGVVLVSSDDKTIELANWDARID